MECPICDAVVLDVLIDDDRACEECGHRWTPDEALLEPVAPHGGARSGRAPVVGPASPVRDQAA